MKRISCVGACVTAAVTIGAAVAPASYAHSPEWRGDGVFLASTPSTVAPIPTASTTSISPSYVSPLLQSEMEVLTRQGISASGAERAIAVQGEIAQTEILTKMEAALASAYAGVWFEPTTAQLHVGATSTASRQTAEGVIARAGLIGSVVVTPVRSTWEQLLATQRVWNSRLAGLFERGEVKLALSPQLNAVSVTLSSAAPASERAALEREASASPVKVYIFVVPSSQLELTPERQGVCKAFIRGKAYCEKPIASGVTMDSPIINEMVKVCTVGPLAIGKGPERNKTYVLTAGHCLRNLNEIFEAYKPSGEFGKIGPSVATVFGIGGDYGAVQVEQPGYWSEPEPTPVFALTAEWKLTGGSTISYPVKGERTPAVGFENCHEGQTTGQSCGQIKAVQVKVTYKEGTRVGGLVEDKGVNSEGGDSGGPWLFIESNNEVLMEGIHSGSSGGVQVKHTTHR